MYKAWRSQETLTLPASLHIWNSAPNVQVGKNGRPEQRAMRMRNDTWREGEGERGDTYQIVKGQALRTVNCKSAKEDEEVKWEFESPARSGIPVSLLQAKQE